MLYYYSFCLVDALPHAFSILWKMSRKFDQSFPVREETFMVTWAGAAVPAVSRAS